MIVLDPLVIAVQLGLAIAAFFIINWIGEHSLSLGYMQLSMFMQTDEAPAFNYLFRVVAPIVYLLLVSAILYVVGLDRFTDNIYVVSIYYVSFRVLFNVFMGRARLLNWTTQAAYAISTIIISVWLYDHVISTRANLLPDFATLSNELWLIIAIFLYQVINQLTFGVDGTRRRKQRYITTQLDSLIKRYGNIADSVLTNDKLRALAYAIMIYESFNRPTVVRWIEYVALLLTRQPKTLGVMQVKSTAVISDKESVRLGTHKMLEDYQEFKARIKIDRTGYYKWDLETQSARDNSAARYIVAQYNRGSDYHSEVIRLWENILSIRFPNTEHILLADTEVAPPTAEDERYSLEP